MSQVHFLFANLCVVVVAWVAADLAMKNREPWRRALATLAGFPIVALIIVLLLGSAGQLSALPATLASGALAAAALALHLRSGNRQKRIQQSPTNQRDLVENDFFIQSLSVAFLGAFGGLWILLICFSGTSFGHDDASYHAPAIAHWLADHRITLAPFNYHAYYPFNAEALSLWFVLPFGTDGSAGLSGLYWGALIVGAAIALAVAQRQPISIGMLVAALLLSSPILLWEARTFTAVDLAGAALVLAAIALSLPSCNRQTGGANFVDAAYSGSLVGLAAGCKVSFAPVASILLIWHVVRLRKLSPGRVWISTAATFVLASAVTGACWYVRNWVLTGNPIFPAAVGPFAGPLGANEASHTALARWIWESPTDLGLWLTIVSLHTKWPFSLFSLAAIGYGAAIWRVARRGSGSDSDDSAQLLLLSVGLVMLVIYPFMPFSGTYNDPHGSLVVSLRYLIAPFAIGIILFGGQLSDVHARRILWICITILAVASVSQPNPTLAFAVGAGVLISWWVTRTLWGSLFAVRVDVLLRIVVPMVLLVLALSAPYRQRLTDQEIYNSGEPQRPIGHAWQALDRLQAGSRVAWFGPASYQYYAIFGRKLQLVPIAVREDGSPYQPLHEIFRSKGFKWWDADVGVQDLHNLASNLADAGIEYVLISKWDQDAWPRQQRTLANSNRAREIYNDGYSAIWEIGGASPQSGGATPVIKN